MSLLLLFGAAAATDAAAGSATGTGSAFNAAVSLKPTAGLASGTGAANAATTKVAATPGLASGTGAANAAVVTESSNAFPGVASGTGSASGASASVKATAGQASGTGVASNATVTSSGSTNAPAGNTAGTGVASGVTAKVAPTAGQATGTGVASNATVSVAQSVAAGLASGTGAASNAKTSIKATAGNASATGAAFGAIVTESSNGFPGTASGTGAAFGATIFTSNVSATATVAPGAGTGFSGAARVAPSAILATTPGAFDPEAFDLGAFASGVSAAAYGPTAAIRVHVGSDVVITNQTVYPEPSAPVLPAAGGTFVDPTFGTTVMRVTDQTDGTSCVNSYSYWPTFNLGSTRFFVLCDGNAQLYLFDPANFQIVSKGPLFDAALPGGGYMSTEDAIWSGTNPDLLYGYNGLKLWAYDVSARTYSLVKDFTGELTPGYLGQMSRSLDDNIFAFTKKDGVYAATGYVVWQRDQNQTLRDVSLSNFDEVQVDKSGRYLAVKAVFGGGVDVQIVDLLTAGVENLTDAAPDYSPGHSDNGWQIVVGHDNWNNQLTIRSLATPHQFQQVISFGADWSQGNHISVLADNEGWFVVSNYTAGSGPVGPFRQEIFQVSTDGSQSVRRLAHHHSVYLDYWDSPRADISRDGRFVAFTSNWGSTSRRDVFVIKVPQGGGSATGTGSAFNATGFVSAVVSASAGVATGTGAASGASTGIAPRAGQISGTGTAFDAATSATSYIVANAGHAAGTGSASGASASVAPTATLASGTGDAYQIAASTTGQTLAETATGTSSAFVATTSIAASIGSATGTGTANNAIGVMGTLALAGVATGTGAAGSATTVVTVNAQAATGTGQATIPSIVTSAYTAVQAETANGTGTAANASASLTTHAEPIAGTGSALNAAGVISDASVNAGHASGSGSAFDAATPSSTSVESASGLGAAFDAYIVIATNAELATGTGTAFDAMHPPFPRHVHAVLTVGPKPTGTVTVRSKPRAEVTA